MKKINTKSINFLFLSLLFASMSSQAEVTCEITIDDTDEKIAQYNQQLQQGQQQCNDICLEASLPTEQAGINEELNVGGIPILCSIQFFKVGGEYQGHGGVKTMQN